jgi:hypothetical protein
MLCWQSDPVGLERFFDHTCEALDVGWKKAALTLERRREGQVLVGDVASEVHIPQSPRGFWKVLAGNWRVSHASSAITELPSLYRRGGPAR